MKDKKPYSEIGKAYIEKHMKTEEGRKKLMEPEPTALANSMYREQAEFEEKKDEVFVVIQCGYEGIDKLLFASTKGYEAAQKVIDIRKEYEDIEEKRIDIKRRLEKKYGGNIEEVQFDFNVVAEEEFREYNKFFLEAINPDSVCLRKWDGKEFSCAWGCRGIA